jgi:hypothetical protein
VKNMTVIPLSKEDLTEWRELFKDARPHDDHVRLFATIDAIEADRDQWKQRAEEIEIERNATQAHAWDLQKRLNHAVQRAEVAERKLAEFEARPKVSIEHLVVHDDLRADEAERKLRELAELGKVAQQIDLTGVLADDADNPECLELLIELRDAVIAAAEPTLEQKLAALDAAEHSRGPLHKMAALLGETRKWSKS